MSRKTIRKAVVVMLLTLPVGACKLGLDVGVNFPSTGGTTGGGTPVAPPSLSFNVQPSVTPVSEPIYPAVQVGFGGSPEGYTCSDRTVTVTLVGSAGVALGGTVTQTAVNSIATFTDLSVNRPGTYSLSATASCAPSATSSSFTVTGPVVSVSISPASPGLTALGATLQMAAEGYDAANVASRGRFNWASTDTTTVRVSADGLVTAVAYGSATIAAATSGGVSASTRVTVAPMLGTLESLSAGRTHTCGVTTRGAAYCWGGNSSGQLGIGSADHWHHATPLAVAGGVTFTVVSAGSDHACGLTAGGAAYCWGGNSFGQLGTGRGDSSAVPVAVAGGLSFVTLSAGGDHTCGLTTDGAAYCWGDNGAGALGIGSPSGLSAVPVAVAGAFKFASLSAGAWHTCGVTVGGTAYCWGDDEAGQLGDGMIVDRLQPVAVSGGLTFASVSAGTLHTCGVMPDGVTDCWGLGFGGTPTAVLGNLPFASVSAGGVLSGGGSSCGVTTGGAAYCWGDDSSGQLGDGSVTNSGTPVAVAGGLSFRALDAGGLHTCGVTTGGVGYCWGSNSYGQLGSVSDTVSSIPVVVAGQ